MLGARVGHTVGFREGGKVGRVVGHAEGLEVGTGIGFAVGLDVGWGVGEAVLLADTLDDLALPHVVGDAFVDLDERDCAEEDALDDHVKDDL